MNSITKSMPATTRITQDTAPCGGPAALPFLPRAGLNLAISAMVALAPAAACENRWMTTRRRWLAFPMALTGCGKRAPAIDMFPETVAGWKRTWLRDVPVSEAPDPAPRTSVTRLQAAGYEGFGKLEARAYELSSSQVGVDIAQRWRPSADTVFFWAGRYFVVVKWQEADRRALQQFTRDLEKRVKGQ